MGCINYRLAQYLPDYIDDRQRGFMRGRLGLDNLLLLEAASMLASRTGTGSPVMCFLDIAAAFPSVLHDYMGAVLDKFLGKHPMNHMIKAMYYDTECDIVLRGTVFPGFKVLCGVRQGCPLSGSLFALIFHPVIVTISDSLYRSAMNVGHDIFGYADDLALILHDLWKQLVPLDRTLADVASATGLYINWKKVQLVPLWRNPDLPYLLRRLSATCPRWKPAKLALSAKYLGIMVGPGVSDCEVFEAPLNKYITRCRYISQLGLGLARASSMHNIFALPVLTYVAQVQADDGIREADLDRAAAILFRGPMYRPPFRFYSHLDEMECNIGLKDVRLECQAAAARCSLTLQQLALARRHLATGSDDDHLRLHPHRAWQDRSAVNRLGQWHDRILRTFPEVPAAPMIQKKCKDQLRKERPPLDYYSLIRDRLTTVLRRLGEEHVQRVDTLAGYAMDTILLASNSLHCTALHAFLRFVQNAFVMHTSSSSVSACSFCGAPLAHRLSHLLVCGGVWVFLAEHCAGLRWDFSAPSRWHFLFGSEAHDSTSACMLVVVWDAIHAGVQSGRFAGDGFEGAVARLIALSKRPGLAGRIAQAVSDAPPAV
jgi:hypothetical protein